MDREIIFFPSDINFIPYNLVINFWGKKNPIVMHAIRDTNNLLLKLNPLCIILRGSSVAFNKTINDIDFIFIKNNKMSFIDRLVEFQNILSSIQSLIKIDILPLVVKEFNSLIEILPLEFKEFSITYLRGEKNFTYGKLV